MQYTRWQQAKPVAAAEAAKKADEDVAKKAVEERERREAEAKRFQEGSRLAFEAAQRAERAEQQRREEEAKRKADQEAQRQTDAAAAMKRAEDEAQARDGRARVDELLAQASRRIESGDVAGAREMLGAAEETSPGAVSFALAETYDPNMLAAWGARGVRADVAKARALYRKALSLGVVGAQNRSKRSARKWPRRK